MKIHYILSGRKVAIKDYSLNTTIPRRGELVRITKNGISIKYQVIEVEHVDSQGIVYIKLSNKILRY